MAATETHLVLSPVGPVVAGQSVVMTATVVTGTGAPVTAGGVSLFEGNDVRQTLRPDANGQVMFTVTRPVGSWYFHAQYNGTNGFAPSTSEAVHFDVVPA